MAETNRHAHWLRLEADHIAEAHGHTFRADCMREAATEIESLAFKLSSALVALKHLRVVRAIGDDDVPQGVRDFARDVLNELEPPK